MRSKFMVMTLFVLALNAIAFSEQSSVYGQEILSSLTRASEARSMRVSSWDTIGRNGDSWSMEAGETRILADIKGTGCIKHIWMTQHAGYRDVLIRIFWDDEENPSVLCPLGDFFGLGHEIVNSYQSYLFSVSTRDNNKFNSGCALNCYIQMPFRKSARIELVNEGNEAHQQYFYIDYELYDKPLDDDVLYFHAQFRRENPCNGWGHEIGVNTDRANIANARELAWNNNYLILEAEGRGHYIGCNLSVSNFQRSWWGEGDDMIWVDGYKWPPDLHGTGSEDYLNQAWGMQDRAFMHNGSSIHEGNTNGYQTSYVFHLENPIRFQKDIRVTIEHGHGNHLSNEMSSVAYWYQTEPHKPFGIVPVEQRKPVKQDKDGNWIMDKSAQTQAAKLNKNNEIINMLDKDFVPLRTLISLTHQLRKAGDIIKEKPEPAAQIMGDVAEKLEKIAKKINTEEKADLNNGVEQLRVIHREVTASISAKSKFSGKRIDEIREILRRISQMMGKIGYKLVAQEEAKLVIDLGDSDFSIVKSLNELELTVGYREFLPIVIVNNSDGIKRLKIRSILPENLYFPDCEIEVEAGEQKQEELEIQTLKVRDHQMKVIFSSGEKEIEMPIRIKATVKMDAPLFGCNSRGGRGYDMIFVDPEGNSLTPREMKLTSNIRDCTLRWDRQGDEQIEMEMARLRTQRDFPISLYRLDSVAAWADVELTEEECFWDRSDLSVDAFTNPDIGGARGTLMLGYAPSWVYKHPNPNKQREGFKDPNNEYLMNRYREYVRAVVARYKDSIDYYETCNEPIGYWFERDEILQCLDMLFIVIKETSRIIREEDPNAIIVGPGFCSGMGAMHIIAPLFDMGMAEWIDALCVHTFPAFGTDVAFPLPGQDDERVNKIWRDLNLGSRLKDKSKLTQDIKAIELWRNCDENTDESNLLRYMQEHDIRLPLFNTELHCGFFTDDRNEALAGLRTFTIEAHQGFIGIMLPMENKLEWENSTYVLPAYKAVTRALTGATPVEKWQSRFIGSGYFYVVYKLFTRGNEDILCFWSNSFDEEEVALENIDSGSIHRIEETHFSLEGEFVRSETHQNCQNSLNFSLKPLEFRIISVITSKPGFGWLENITN